ncbi:hypothetical protein BC829DRAFT_406304 [Chytridium lagenaria]|nr:hypothetical protein BC829DRAFT_406304 [Chytridium lagenaria]
MRRRLFLIGTGLPVASVIWTAFYIRRVVGTSSLDETPKSFSSKVKECTATASSAKRKPPTWGFYQRNLDSRFLRTSTDPLTIFVQSVFGSNAYWLERKLSSTIQDPQTFVLKKGETFGNLRLVDTPSEHEAIFRYEYPGFDFILYFGVFQRSVGLGFIELNGDIVEDIGSRLYTRLLLEGGARNMNTT